MKKYIILLLIFICTTNLTLAEEIKLVPDTENPIEKNINLEVPSKEMLENNSQKLENHGFILQNSIPPVKGVKYDSQVIPTDKPMQKDIVPNEPEGTN